MASDSIPRPAVELVAQIMEHNARQSASLTNSLMDGYKRERDHARAELAAIREAIGIMCSGPYMPNPARIIDALYPDDETIRSYARIGD